MAIQEGDTLETEYDSHTYLVCIALVAAIGKEASLVGQTGYMMQLEAANMVVFHKELDRNLQLV